MQRGVLNSRESRVYRKRKSPGSTGYLESEGEIPASDGGSVSPGNVTGKRWSSGSGSSGGEGGGQALCGYLQPRVAGGEKWRQKPLAGQSPMAPPSLTRSSSLMKTCVHKTGCGTLNFQGKGAWGATGTELR
jgi:hypothetical protein